LARRSVEMRRDEQIQAGGWHFQQHETLMSDVIPVQREIRNPHAVDPRNKVACAKYAVLEVENGKLPLLMTILFLFSQC